MESPNGSRVEKPFQISLKEKSMIKTQNRREFLVRCTRAGGVCCALLACGRPALPQGATGGKTGSAKPLDPKALSYCGIPKAYCESQCELFKATRDSDAKLKKTVYDQWEMKKKFGVDFDPGKIFCYGCKPGDKPLKVGMAECPVRVCPMASGLESCVQCLDLAACDKAFWKEWPIAFQAAKTLQARYKVQSGAVLKNVLKK